MLQIYHNPKCRKSRAGLDHLKAKGLDFEIIEYLKTGLTKEMLQQVLQRLNVKPIELVRTQEDYFKQQLRGKKFSDEEWIQIIIENPKLLKRPIIIHNFKAVWADPAEEADKIL
ncbi:MAG: arsenate reductase family protein [Bacteroidetes bacterium]|nr:arsenate reductase family protein [Bacteroidota bacterium]